LLHHLPHPSDTGRMPSAPELLLGPAERGQTRHGPPRRLQGTGTHRISETHVRPKHRRTWRVEERTASR
jgi:hypothetical protein